MTIKPGFLSLYHEGRLNKCTTLYLLESDEMFSITSKGELQHEGYRLSMNYCVETMVKEAPEDMNMMVLKCKQEDECHMDNKHYRVIFSILSIVSLVSLGVTFIVYIYVPDLCNLHGKIVVSNVLSVFFVTCYILIVYNISIENHIFCSIIGYFGYFFILSMFCWITVICTDLCFTLCTTLPGTSEGSKFPLISVVAWGFAGSFTLILVVLDVLLPTESVFKPNVGASSCFIEDNGHKRLLLFHSPILLLMLASLILYLVTVYSLIKHTMYTNFLRRDQQ